MTDERPYDVVGREPLDDEALEAAIGAHRADNPDADDRLLRSAATRLRRLNDEARQRATEADRVQHLIDQAAEDRITLSWADAADALRQQDETTRQETADRARRQAKQYAAQASKRPRLPGRKKGSRTVGCDQITEKYWALKRSLQRSPTQEELADNLEPPITGRTLRDTLADCGLPWPIE